MALKQAIWVLIIAISVYYLLCYVQDQFDPGSLANKNVIVVGASSGIGEQMAYWYATYGANVFIVARREEKLKQVVAHCKTLAPSGNSQIGYTVADMAFDEDRKTVIKKALEFFEGDIDQLILNHAYMSPTHTWNGSEAQLAKLKDILNVNVVSFVHLTALALPSLKRSNGSVGVVGSLTDPGSFSSTGYKTDASPGIPDGSDFSWTSVIDTFSIQIKWTLVQNPALWPEFCFVPCRCPFPFTLEYQASKFALDGFFSGLRFEFKTTKQNVSITYCTIGLIETNAGMTALNGVLSKLSTPSGVLLKLLNPGTPEGTAHAIISATTQRKGELYYPGYQLPWLQTVLRSMFPQLLEMLDLGYIPGS